MATKYLVTRVSPSVLVWRQSAILFTRYAISKIRDQKFYLERAGIARAFLPFDKSKRQEGEAGSLRDHVFEVTTEVCKQEGWKAGREGEGEARMERVRCSCACIHGWRLAYTSCFIYIHILIMQYLAICSSNSSSQHHVMCAGNDKTKIKSGSLDNRFHRFRIR